MRAELSALQAEHESLCTSVADTLNATANAFGTLVDERREQRAEIDDLKAAIAKLGSTELHGRKEGFQFAREKSGSSEAADLPSFLPPRRTVN